MEKRRIRVSESKLFLLGPLMQQYFLEYFQLVLRKRTWLILLLCVCYSLLALLAIRQLKPKYRAKVKVFLDLPTASSPLSIGGLDSMFKSLERETFIASQKELLESYLVYEKVQKSLEANAVSVAAPATPFFNQVKNNVRMVLFGKTADDSSKWVDFKYKYFKDKLSFKYDKKSFSTFTIGYKDKYPEIALKTVQYLSDALIDVNIGIATQNASKISSFLGEKVKEVEQKIQESNRAIATFIKKNNFPQQENLIEARYKRYLDTQQQLANAEGELAHKKALVSQVTSDVKKLSRDLRDKITTSHEERIAALLAEISRFETSLLQQEGDITGPVNAKNLSRRLASLRKKLTREFESVPKMLSKEALQDLLAKAIDESVRYKSQFSGAKALVDYNKKLTRRLATETEKYPNLEAELSQILLSNAQLVKVHEILLQNYLGSVVQSDVKFSNLHIIEKPSIDPGFFMAHKLRVFFLSVVLIVIATILLVTLFDIKVGTVLSKRQLSELSHPTFLGTFPHLKDVKKYDLIYLCQKNMSIMRLAYKLKRYLKKTETSRAQCITFCSDQPNSGKSLSAIGFAASLSKINHSVLIIDCDLRATLRSSTKYFTAANRKRHIEKDLITFAEKITSSHTTGKISGITVVHAIEESIDQDKGIDFLHRDFHPTLETLRPYFDYILIDAPPIHLVDALIITEAADAVIICAPEGRTTLRNLQETTAAIDQQRSAQSLVFSLLTDSRLTPNLKAIDQYGYYQMQKAA